MKWLPKEKRNPFILVVVITVAILALICFGMLRSQRNMISQIAANRQATDKQLQGMEKAIKGAESATNELAASVVALAHAEEDMASGDLYSWTYNTLRTFKQPYKVEIPEIGHPVDGEVDLIPAFPYRQMRFTISGTGYYHEIGKFVSDFENTFPHIRVTNLTLDPATEGEKLTFRMDITALIKPNAS